MILAFDSEMQQQSAAETSVYQQLFMSSIHGQQQVYLNPFLMISVHRNTILQETINQLCLFSKHSESDLKKPLKVNFEGEEAIDAGHGMKKEFFLLLMKELLDEKYGMFFEVLLWFIPPINLLIIILRLCSSTGKPAPSGSTTRTRRTK